MQNKYTDDDIRKMLEITRTDERLYSTDHLTEQEVVPKPEERGPLDTVWSSVKRSADTTTALAYGAGASIAHIFGADGVRDWALDGYFKNLEEAEENKAEIGSYKNIKGVGDAGTYALETLGELAPTIATIILGGGIGGAAANYAGRKMVAGMVKKDIEKRVAAGIAKDVAEREAVKNVGRMVGAWQTAAQLEAGGMYGEDVEEFGTEGASPGRAQLFGQVSGATDIAFGAEGALLRSFAGKFGKGAAKKMDDALAKKLFKTALGEGGQEMLQEAIAIGHNALGEIENFGGNLSDVTDQKGEQYKERMIEAGIKGAIGGVGMGVGVHGLDKINESRQIEANKAAAQEDVSKLTAHDDAEYAQRIESEMQAAQQQRTQQQSAPTPSVAEQVSGQRTGINGPGGATDATPQAQPDTVTPPSQPVDQQTTQNQQTPAPTNDGVTRGQTELDSIMAQPLTDGVRQQLVERHEVAVNRLRTIGNELDPTSKQRLIDEVNALTYIVDGMGKVANGEPIARALQAGSPQEYQYQTPQQRQAEAEARSHAGVIDQNQVAAQTQQQSRHIEGEREARHNRNQPVHPSQANDAYADEWAVRQGVQRDTAQRRAGLDAQQQIEPSDLGAEVETMRSRNTQFLAHLDQKKKAGEDVTADDVAMTLGEVKRLSKDETVSDEEWLGILTEVESTLPSNSRMKEWLSVLDQARQRVQAERETKMRHEAQSLATKVLTDTMGEAATQVRAERDADLRNRANTDPAAWREYRDKKRAKEGVNQDMVDAEFAQSVEQDVKPQQRKIKSRDTSGTQVKDNSDAPAKVTEGASEQAVDNKPTQADIEQAVSTIASQGVNKLTAVLDKIAAKKKSDADKARQEAERVEEVRAKLRLDEKKQDAADTEVKLPSKQSSLYNDDDTATLTDPLSGYGSALDYDNTKADPVEEATGYINEDGDWVETKKPTDGRKYSTKQGKPISTGDAAKDAMLDKLRGEVGGREAKDPANIKKRAAGFEKRVKEVFGPKADYRKLKSGNMMVVTPNGAAILVRQQDALVTDMVGADGKPLEANGWWEDQATVLERHGIKLNRGGIMMLAKDRDAGTADHETMHAAMSLALTPLELKILRKRYMKDDMTEIDFDEAVAEAYQKWKPSERNGIFGKMRQLGDWLNETLFGYRPTDPDDVFKNVRKGKAWKQDGGTQRTGGIDKSSSRAIDGASEVNSDLQPIIDELIANGFLPNNNTDGVSNDKEGLSNRQGQSANRPQPNTSADIYSGRGLHSYRARTLHDLRTRRSKGNDSLAEGDVSSTYRRGHTGLSVIHGTEVKATEWTASKEDATIFEAFNYTSPDMFEMSGDEAARVFRNAIVRAKQANKHGAAVYVYDEADYKDMRLFISGDATAGFALKGTDIVSVFSAKKGSGVAVPLLHFAIQEGGRKLDAFDTILPHIYSIAGFRVAKRLKWDEEQAPMQWDKKTFQKFNGGEPDVVFMVYDPARADIYTPGEGEYAESYDDAVKSQDDIVATLPATGYPAIKSSKDQTRYSLKGGHKAGSNTKLYDSVYEDNPEHTELLDRALGPNKGGVLERTVETLKHLYQGDKESRQHFKESIFGIIRDQTVDSFDRINVLGEMVDDATGDNKGKLAYQTMRLSTTIDVAMSNMLQHGRLHFLLDEGDGVNRLTDESRGVTNEGLIPLIEKLGDDLPNFLMHRVARRARKLHGEGRENNFTIDNINTLDKIVGDASRFDEANEWFNKLQERILNYAIDSGTLSSDAKEHLDIIDYLPFYRVRETAFGDDAAMVGFTNTNNIVSGIKKLKGGRDALDDPLTNILKNWSMIVTQAAKNNARTRVVDVMKEFGNEVIQPVSLAEAMADRSAATINVMRDGKHEYYLVKDKALYDALITAPSVISDNAFMALGQKAKRWLTYGATFSPDFRVANFFRDTIQTVMLNKGYTPMDAVRGFKKAWTNHEDYIELRAHGGAFSHGYLYGTDPDNVHKYIEEVVVKDGKTNIVKHNAKKMLDWWARVGDAAENANRVGLYSKLKDQGVSQMEAAYEAKDILDFSMRGGSQALQIATSLIPFLNARIAGLYKVRRGLLGKSLTDFKPEFYRTLGMLTSASLALAAWNASENEEEWDKLQPHDKMDYYHIWALGQHIRLPKPFEIGAIFSSLPEALMDAARKDDRKIIAEWFKHTTTNTFAVDWKAQVFKPALEIWANKDSFTGNDIIPMGMEYLAPEMQYKENTKSIAKVIGNALGVAPVHVEHVVKGYTASLGMMAMTAADIALEYLVDPVAGTELADKKPINTNNIWGVGRFVRDDSIATSRYVSDFYDYARRVDEVAYTTRALQKDGDPKRLRDYIEDNLELVQNKKLVSSLKKQFSNIRTRRLLINKSKTMTTERKAEELRKLVKMRNDLGRLFVEEMKRQSRYKDGRK